MPKLSSAESELGQVLEQSGVSEEQIQGVKPADKAVWRGPQVDGVTQSLLGRYVVCKERFRILTIEGLTAQRTFSSAIEYGQMWHVCEETFAASGNPVVNNPVTNPPWLVALMSYAMGLMQRHPLYVEEIKHWATVCALQFPIYIEYWKRHKDVVKREPLMQEEVFCIPYELPSGREVGLRGKFDSVDYIKNGRKKEIWLKENKSKGQIVEGQLQEQLDFDLQTSMYLVALSLKLDKIPTGVIYNVVRRPLSGGRHSIVRHKARGSKLEETPEAFYSRLRSLITSDPGYFFLRWNVEFSTDDIVRFENQFLVPCLEELCDDYEWWTFCQERDEDPFNHQLRAEQFPRHLPRHWRLPYGIYNVIAKGGQSEYDHYLRSGSTVGLERVNSLFSELESE